MENNFPLVIFSMSEKVINNEDLIDCTEAAEMLGYKTTKSVRDMITKGVLSSYKRPYSRRLLVSIKEVEVIKQPILMSEGGRIEDV